MRFLLECYIPGDDKPYFEGVFFDTRADAEQIAYSWLEDQPDGEMRINKGSPVEGWVVVDMEDWGEPGIGAYRTKEEAEKAMEKCGVPSARVYSTQKWRAEIYGE